MSYGEDNNAGMPQTRLPSISQSSQLGQSSQQPRWSYNATSRSNGRLRSDFNAPPRQSSVSSFGRRTHSRQSVAHGNAQRNQTFLDSQLQESKMFKVVIDGDDGGVAMQQVHQRIEAALRVRTFYKKENENVPGEAYTRLPSRVTITRNEGVFQVSGHDVLHFYSLPSWKQFAEGVNMLRPTVSNTTCVKACAHRLGIMQERSRMFFLLNAEMEERHNLRKAGGVFASVAKVNTSVMLSKCLDAQELLDSIVDACSRTPDAPIRLRNGRNSTLRELLQSYGVRDPKQLTVAGLGWQQQASEHHFIDTSPETQALSAELRFSFLSVRGLMAPKLLRRHLDRAEWSTRSPQASEYSIPIFGAYEDEVRDVLTTLCTNNIGPYKRVRWVLQLRLQHAPPSAHPVQCETIQDQLDNIFVPLFKATLEKTVGSAVAAMLQHVGALQLESSDGPEVDFDPNVDTPDTVPYGSTQSELYFFYYIYANLTVLNSLRRRKGLNTLQLRCSGGHRAGMDDLIGGYMLADVITRSTKLMHFPVLQYLCGLHGVGLSMSPLSDHMQGIVSYQNHPLPNFLHRCLKVTVATEAPLLYHHSQNALTEEYATAQKMFRLGALDMTELAHNSVTMSSFPDETKREWLGDSYDLGVEGNEFELSQVTNIRLAFREGAWAQERSMMRDLYLRPVTESTAESRSSRWHFLSNVEEVEYNTVLDSRIRFPRTVLNGPHIAGKSTISALRVARALDLRHKYIWRPPNPWEVGQRRGVEADFLRKTGTFNEDEWTYAASDAVFISYQKNAVHAWPRTLPTLDDFHKDLKELQDICASAEVKDLAHRRLENLDHKFRLHLALNHANEAGTTAERLSSNRDIYQATKVDTHIHMAAGMTPKQMLTFVLQKLKDSADDIAMRKGDEIITLGKLFINAGITTNLTVDQLDVQADHTLFERFDNFNNKYNPMENGDLRSLMLKTDNFMNGRYFAELIHNVFAQYSRDRYTYAENRVSVYGINIKEWEKLSHWFATHGMSNKHNKWIIQVPRVYKVFRAQNVIGSFGQYLQNIFEPLWEASLHPSEHPTLHNFLKHVSGFDSVDNEATLDLPFTPISPWAWTSIENPPYNYYLYYLYANVRTLNEFRASRGFSTFALRPHCGESGSEEHLYGAFLCANSICHGINLRNDIPMQYLYYLTQVGLHVSPLSNNALFLKFLNNPFPDFFRRGLNVSLSTDDPMMFHQTQEPLIEEYSIAARVWGLSPNDLCEIARNSVLQCGFDYNFKREAIGDRWYMSSSLGNDPLRTHLSDIRVAFRFETYHTELQHLEMSSERKLVRFMMTSAEEREINEQNLDLGPEEIILSTHDQEMEVMLRDIDAKREQIRVAKIQVDYFRRQQRSLVENITEVGARRQEEQEEADRELRQKVTYDRERKPSSYSPSLYGGGGDGFQTAESETVQRLLRWRPMPPRSLHSVHQVNLSSSANQTRPLPPMRHFQTI